MSEEEAKEQLPPLRAARDQAKQELSELEPVDNVLVLHPGAVKKYAEQIKLLSDQVGKNLTMDSQDAANWIRSLITKVTVRRHPKTRRTSRSKSRAI